VAVNDMVLEVLGSSGSATWFPSAPLSRIRRCFRWTAWRAA
jgi:hypothetical protein